jgi:hypothetical protein
MPSVSSFSCIWRSHTEIRTCRPDRWLEIGNTRGRTACAPDHSARRQTDNHAREFEQMVAQTYQALALRARVVVLEKIAAAFSNGDRSLPHVENVLRNELSVLADRQSQLVGLLDDLNVLQIDSSKVPIAFAGKGTIGARTSWPSLASTSRGLDSLPLTESDQTVLELARRRIGRHRRPRSRATDVSHRESSTSMPPAPPKLIRSFFDHWRVSGLT